MERVCTWLQLKYAGKVELLKYSTCEQTYFQGISMVMKEETSVACP